MRKEALRIFLFFVFGILMINFIGFVSAQPGGFPTAILGSGSGASSAEENLVAKFIDDFAKFVEPIAKAVLGDVKGTPGTSFTIGEIFFAKVMLFFILLMVVNLAVKNFPGLEDKGGIVFIISLIVSILGIRFIFGTAIIQTIWLPYGALGVALTSILPFIVFFLFVEGFDSSFIRKLGWVSFIVIFLALAALRWGDLRVVRPESSFNGYSFAWLYLIIAILSGILLIFDKKIRAMFRMASIGKIVDRGKRIKAVRVMGEIEDLYDDLTRAKTDADRTAVKGEIDAKEKILKTLHE